MQCKIIWFTGLSGSGKTTLSKHISCYLKKKKFKVKKIDGDIFRKKTNVNSFSKTNITLNNLSIINHIKHINSHYDYIIVSVISPLRKTRKLAKKKFGKNYYEIYTKCRLQELVRRDTKNLYEKARRKIIKDLIGFNSKIKYESTYYKKITINTADETIKESVNKILKKIII